MQQKIAIEQLIDESPLSIQQFIVVGLCALVAMIDGFDTQCIGLVAPEIASEWAISGARFGPVFGIGLFGGLLGGLFFGAVADRIGRKPTLLAAVFVMSVASLTTQLCTSIGELAAIRLVTGLGLGGALPAIVSLTSEYAPRRLRATLVAVMFCGFPLGAILGGLVSAWMIPIYGWPSVFCLGGAAPLALLPVLMLFLPESGRFLAQRKPQELPNLIARLGWTKRWNGEVGTNFVHPKASVRGLFTDGLASRTLLLWLILFCCLLMTYFLLNWMPMLARRSGIAIRGSVVAVAMLNVGGLAGCLTIGWLSDRLGAAKVMGASLVLGSFAVACLGQAGGSNIMLLITAFLAGFLGIGAQMCTVALCPMFYETALRATGVGWSMAAGRLGAIVGPVAGGLLLAAGLSAGILFLIAGMVCFVAAVAMFALGRIKPVAGA